MGIPQLVMKQDEEPTNHTINSERVWTREELQRCIDRYNEGWSMGAIANEIGRSRNAVAGKIHRARNRGLIQAPTRRPPKEKVAKVVVPSKVRTKVVKLPVLPPPPEIIKEPKRVRLRLVSHDTEVTFAELRSHQCKYPLGDPRRSDFRFCGKPRLEKSPYCNEHTAMCFNKPEPRFRGKSYR